MPCLEITLPRLDSARKERLATNLTEAFVSATAFGGDIFGVRFFEYGPGEASVGGRVWRGEGDSPYLHALLYSPRLKRAVKQKLAEALTHAFTEGVGHAGWKPVIHFCEHPYDNVSVGGKLLSDAYEECAKRPFYYELPRD